MGEIYTTVDAEVINDLRGVSLYSSPGGTPGGGEEMGVTLLWNADGFTGSGWSNAWGSQYVPLQANWDSNYYAGYGPGQSEFEQYIKTERPSDLNDYLGASWTDGNKQQFIIEMAGKGINLYTQGCIQE